MSWSASEYLYMVLVKNRALLPPEALFVLRCVVCVGRGRAGV